MLRMKQTASRISTYTADVSGVCSALYELGGMTIMHDASGCNSTYNTHDEPRWYDMDSMVYITGLSEMEAVMGDDEKFIDDIVQAAKELSPQFIALAGTPIPMMIGTDFKAMARMIEERTGILSFGFATNGMHSYLSGISMAYEALARRMTDPACSRTPALSANILGLTPLDFSINGYAQSIREAVKAAGFEVIGTWAMDCGLEDIRRAGGAWVNLVVSQAGLAAAQCLRKLYGIPYVIGTPVGEAFTKEILAAMRESAVDGANRKAFTDAGGSPVVIIGEGVMSRSLASALKTELHMEAKVLCPVDADQEVLGGIAIPAEDEEDLIPHLTGAKLIIADPLYRPICPETAKFIALPHEAFSGRIYRSGMRNLVTEFETVKEQAAEAAENGGILC